MGRILPYLFPVFIVGIIGFILYRNKRKAFLQSYSDWEHKFDRSMKW